MKKILPLAIVSMLILGGCSSSDKDSAKSVYNEAFENTFNSNYYYESKTDNGLTQTLSYTEYFLGDDLGYISYCWYGYVGSNSDEAASIHYYENDNLILYSTDENLSLTNEESANGSVDEKSNLFKNDNIDITKSSITDDGVSLEFTVGSGDTYYVVDEITIEDNRITKEVTTMYQDEDHESVLTTNTTMYYENKNDAATELEKAKNYKDANISEFADLRPEL